MRLALLTTDSRECFRDYDAPTPYYGTAAAALIKGLSALPEIELRVISRTHQRFRPDIVHGEGTERDCAISAVFSGYPSVITIHGNMRAIAKVNHARLFSYQR